MPPPPAVEVEVGGELEVSVGVEGSCVTIAGRDWVGDAGREEVDDGSIGSAVAVASVLESG